MNNFQLVINDLINNLAKIVLDGLSNEEIDRDEVQEISQFILDEKRKITSENQIDDFLNKLNSKYYFLFHKFIENYQKQRQFQIEEQKKIQEIKNQLLKFGNW